jgi:hypothetical protein
MKDGPHIYGALRKCLGYVENGTSTTVTISQDDATKTFMLGAGGRKYYGDTLTEVLVIAGSAEDQHL